MPEVSFGSDRSYNPSGNQRFPRCVRLTSSRDFSRVLSQAEFRRESSGVLVLARHNQLHLPRLGLGIAKKHLAAAVDRNRVKRQIRESFRLSQARLAGWDIVVLSRKNLKSLSISDLQRNLEKHWYQLTTCDD